MLIKQKLSLDLSVETRSYAHNYSYCGRHLTLAVVVSISISVMNYKTEQKNKNQHKPHNHVYDKFNKIFILLSGGQSALGGRPEPELLELAGKRSFKAKEAWIGVAFVFVFYFRNLKF